MREINRADSPSAKLIWGNFAKVAGVLPKRAQQAGNFGEDKNDEMELCKLIWLGGIFLADIEINWQGGFSDTNAEKWKKQGKSLAETNSLHFSI